jgi:NADPH-dependent glutamate synthase beta subunit-like oxidoreductase
MKESSPSGKVAKADIKKKVAVIGGRTPGIVAADVLCPRGHESRCTKKADGLAARYIMRAPDFKQDLADVRQIFKAPCRKVGSKKYS